MGVEDGAGRSLKLVPKCFQLGGKMGTMDTYMDTNEKEVTASMP